MNFFHRVLRAWRSSGCGPAAGAAALVVVSATVPVPAVAMPVTIDFETDGNGASLTAGTLITREWENLGISLRSTNGALRLFNANCGPGFPCAPCTGGDPDLASGARFGRAGEVPAQSNVLIRQDPSIIEPGDTAAAGVIRFDFDRHVRLVSIALLDNDNEDGITLNIFKNGSVTPSTSILRPSVGFDNFFETYVFAGGATWVTALELLFPGSGAVAALTVASVPTPAAMPLLLFALVWLGSVSRRRKAAR